MKVFQVLVFMLFTGVVLNAQQDIKLFPFSPDSAAASEPCIVQISESEIFLFYRSAKGDSILFSRTNNAGQTWFNPKLIRTTNNSIVSPKIYLCALITGTKRIVLAWSIYNEGMFTIYSDDFGESWSQPQLVLGYLGPSSLSKKNENLNLSLLSDGRIFLSAEFGRTYYRQSIDDGASWGDNTDSTLFIFSSAFTFYGDLSFVSVDNSNLLAFYHFKPLSGKPDIYIRKSSDGGMTWGDHIPLITTENSETRPRTILLSDGKIILAFEREYSTIQSNVVQKDIFYITSSDNGNNWNQEQRFTKYIGDDSGINLSRSGSKPYLFFITQRFAGFPIRHHLAYGILGETIESFTPPVIYEARSGGFEYPPKNSLRVILQIKAQDDDSLNVVYMIVKDSIILELYDDGNHSDGAANDFIFGNTLIVDIITDGASSYMNVNKIGMPISSNGNLGSARYSYIQSIEFAAVDNYLNIASGSKSFTFDNSAEGFYDGNNFLFAGGFFLSGYTNSQLWAAGQASSSIVENFINGKVNDPTNPKNKIYSVNAVDIPFGMSWQNWKDAVDLGASFYDGDKDGIYNPRDLNANGIWDRNEDMPDLLGERTIWTVFNDGVPGNQRARFAGVEPQGIEIQQTLFASSLPELEDILFIRYVINNTGTVAQVLDSVMLGLWSDPDILNYENDLAGSDTLLQSSFCYNSVDTEPLAFYTTLLQGPQTEGIRSDTAYINRGPQIGVDIRTGFKNSKIKSFNVFYKSHPTRGDPNTSLGLRMTHLGKLTNGEFLDPCTDPYGEVKGGVNCAEVNPLFSYSGDPVASNGWISTQATDVRISLNTGPFTLVKDQPVEVVFAYTLAKGTDRLNAIVETRKNVETAFAEYKNNFSNLAYKPGEPAFVIDNYKLYQNYPNPFNPSTTIRYDIVKEGYVTLKVYDILGREVKTLVNEFQSAKRYEARLDSGELASGVYFYQLNTGDFNQTKKMILIK